MSSIFDEHIGDIEQVVSLEAAKPTSADKSKHSPTDGLRAHRLPTSIKTKVEKLIDLMEHKDPQLKVEKVEYKVARELFALIPEYVNSIETARLTRAPSVANADLLRNALVKNAPILQDSIVTELHEYYTDLFYVYERCKGDIQAVVSSLNTFTEIVKPKVEKLTDGKYLIMVGKDTYDLRTASLDTVKSLDLHNIDYEPLRQKLPNLVDKLATDDLINLLALVDTNRDTVSGGRVYTYFTVNIFDILNICTAIGNNTVGNLSVFSYFEELYTLIGNAYSDKTVEVPGYKLEQAYNHYNITVNALMKYTKLKANIDSSDSVLDAINSLLDLLGAI